MSDLRDLLMQTKVRDLLDSKPLLNSAGHRPPEHPVCLDSSLTVQEGSAALAMHKISSAPVYDAKECGFIGMLDFRDLITYVLEVFHKIPKTTELDPEMEISDIVKRALSDKGGVPLKYICNLSKLNPLIPILASAPVLDAIKALVEHKVHRVVVIEPTENNSNRFLGVLSSSTIAAFIASKAGKIARANENAVSWADGDKSVEAFNLIKSQSKIVSVLATDNALHLMYDHRVSSVPIVENRETGSFRLIGNISMSDMKEILSYKGGWRKLFDNTFKFFSELRITQGLEAQGNDRVPSFVVHPHSSLLAAIEKMVATRSHRVWIVQDIDRLVGVVSLSDVMAIVASSCGST